MNHYYEAILAGTDVRANLIELKKECKNKQYAQEFFAACDSFDWLGDLFGHEDAKVRKNAANLVGIFGLQEFVDKLYDAYEKEQTRFVKSAYLAAMTQLDASDYEDQLKKRYEELLEYRPTPEEQKHVGEERKLLHQLLADMDAIDHHKFCGWKKRQDVIFTTEKSLRANLSAKLQRKSKLGIQVTDHPYGVRARTTELGMMSQIRCYRELLFVLNTKLVSSDVEKLAAELAASNMYQLTSENHEGKGPFYYRIELRGRFTLEEKSKFTNRLANLLDEKLGGRMRNSTGNYEVEIRLMQLKDGGFYPCLKFYTIADDRFSYRKESLSTSLHPSLAASLVELAKAYYSEDSTVLDACCGVGTLMIERQKRLPVYDAYGVDIYGEAIRAAKINAAAAQIECNFITRSITEFTTKHTINEVFADLPERGKKTKEEHDLFYKKFFDKMQEVLAAKGYLFLYSDEAGIVKKYLRLHPLFSLKREFAIRPKEGKVFYIIQKRT